MVEKRHPHKTRPDDALEKATTRSALLGPRITARRTGISSFARGDVLADRYRIERFLGRGGMGDVYEARDEELAIPVALKTLRFDVGREQESVWYLKREVLLARLVAHPHVCRVYDLGRHGEGEGAVWFLTMEFLPGETLQERLRRRGRLAPEEALPLAEQMAAGLGAAHRAGVVHRDFKSGNVMLVWGAASERAVVTDFGLARAAGATDEKEAMPLRATPAYMAPEQVLGEEAGPAADVYALGVVLYEVMTGKLPFAGKTAEEVARRRLDERAPSPRSVVREIDERWEAVILRCLSRQPWARFEKVEEVADALAGRSPLAAAGTALIARPVHSLPAERDLFVGREMELDELEGRFRGRARLVTLLGTAGMGKTRLAVQFGWRSLRQWPGGVWFCDLTESRSREGIASAVATSLGVPLGKDDPVEQLTHAIAGRGRCLLVLDNFEQVAAQAGETVSRWLEHAEEARFVATSRERLNVRGEEVQAVEPLSLESGMALFVDRARRQRPGLELKGSETASVQEVVRLVDGIPLAIELAAARIRVMTAAQLVERMRDRFHLLVGGTGGRHATLRAAIDGSWELLPPWEKAAWAQCAVFEGGFTLEAAEAVLDLTAWSEAPWVVDVVQSLVDKSLLRAWVPEGGSGSEMSEARFGMYPSLQEYARGKLEQERVVPGEGSGAHAVRAAEERHGRWYSRYGSEEALEKLERHGGVGRRRALQLELENLVAACRRAGGRGDGGIAVAAYQAAWAVLELQGPYGLGVDLGAEVLGAPLGRDDRARALGALGQAEWGSGRMQEARTYFEAGLALHRELGDRRSEGFLLGKLGTVHRDQGRMEEAQRHFEAALAIHREVGDRRSEGIVRFKLGNLHLDEGRLGDARVHYEAALAIHREMGNRRYEGMTLSNLGLLNEEQGRLEEARTQLVAALAIHREVNNRRSEGLALSYLGSLHEHQGHLEEARARFEAALAIHREMGNRRSEGVVLFNLGIVHHKRGQTEEATNALARGEKLLREVGDRRGEGTMLASLGGLHIEQGRMEEATDALARGEELLREVGDRSELGKLLCLRADIERRSGDIETARATLSEAETLAALVGSGSDSELGRELAKLRQALVRN